MTDCTLEASFLHGDPELLVTIDTDSWLESELERNATLDALMDDFRAANEDMDEGARMRAFPQYVYDRAMIAYNALDDDERDQEMTPTPPTGFYGEGEPVQVSTPNHDNFLSIDVEFVLWADYTGSHVILRKADAYSGYGDATVYDALGDNGTEMLEYDRAVIACANDGEPPVNPEQQTIDGSPAIEPCRAVWDYLPGHNGVDQGHGYGNLPDWKRPGDYPAEEGTEPKRGVLVIDTDERKAFCPVCGRSSLAASKL